ncbi:hypothetical protein MRB53_010340 [Persea americana]|uniref:Uncharacterized protein n=1 Tax=Persea americana TaxID=3435 RepID=A0ACC2LSB9_PERAE|nr:hypothetical protein MRB53_010340 [Persea americana]
MIRTSTLEAQSSNVTSKLHIDIIRCGADMENNERLVDVQINVLRLNNNGIRNFSNSTVDTLLGNNLIDVQVQDGSNAIGSIRYADNKELHFTTPKTYSNDKRATIAEWKSLKPDSHTSNVVVGIKATISRFSLIKKYVYDLSSIETYPRYIMRLTLTDHMDTANVVLLDNEVAQLLQTSKDELSSLIAHGK